MPWYVNSLEEGSDWTDVLSQSYRKIAEAEERQVEQLIGMKSHDVMFMVTENQISFVV